MYSNVRMQQCLALRQLYVVVYRVSVRIDVGLDVVRLAFLVQVGIHEGWLRDMVQQVVDHLLLVEEVLVGDLRGVIVRRYQSETYSRDDGQYRHPLHFPNFP